MEWWQILLIGVASLLVGMLLGVLVHLLLKRLARMRETALVVKEPVVKEQLVQEPVVKESAVEEPMAKESLVQEPVVKEPAIKWPVTKEPAKVTLPDLIFEVENNIKTATQPWTGKLLPFQTHTWEVLQDTVDNVPATAQEDLKQIYVDIRLANSIVRLATEFNRRSSSLDDSYKKLCVSIAERLDRIKPLIERP